MLFRTLRSSMRRSSTIWLQLQTVNRRMETSKLKVLWIQRGHIGIWKKHRKQGWMQGYLTLCTCAITSTLHEQWMSWNAEASQVTIWSHLFICVCYIGHGVSWFHKHNYGDGGWGQIYGSNCYLWCGCVSAYPRHSLFMKCGVMAQVHSVRYTCIQPCFLCSFSYPYISPVSLTNFLFTCE